MPSTTKRAFLLGLLTSASVLALPKTPASAKPNLAGAVASPINQNRYRWVPVLYGDGVIDDTKALQTFINGGQVWCERTKRLIENDLGPGIVRVPAGNYRVTAIEEPPSKIDDRVDCDFVGVTEDGKKVAEMRMAPFGADPAAWRRSRA